MQQLKLIIKTQGNGGQIRINPPSERGELIDFFVREINVERQGTKYQPIEAKTVAIKTAHLSLQDLYYMKSVALDGQRRNYPISKFFFGSLKVKPEISK